jgi:DNA (cytosine-5)-methyltransferase 1
MNGKLKAISLFSGYGGIDLALSEWCRPILYCDIERYAQAILLSRMDDGSLPFAPIWNDVTTLDGSQFKGLVNIVYGGFPCQDISVAGIERKKTQHRIALTMVK